MTEDADVTKREEHRVSICRDAYNWVMREILAIKHASCVKSWKSTHLLILDCTSIEVIKTKWSSRVWDGWDMRGEEMLSMSGRGCWRWDGAARYEEKGERPMRRFQQVVRMDMRRVWVEEEKKKEAKERILMQGVKVTVPESWRCDNYEQVPRMVYHATSCYLFAYISLSVALKCFIGLSECGSGRAYQHQCHGPPCMPFPLSDNTCF